MMMSINPHVSVTSREDIDQYTIAHLQSKKFQVTDAATAPTA